MDIIEDKSSSKACKEFLQWYYRNDKDGDVISFGEAKFKVEMKILFNDSNMFNAAIGLQLDKKFIPDNNY